MIYTSFPRAASLDLLVINTNARVVLNEGFLIRLGCERLVVPDVRNR